MFELGVDRQRDGLAALGRALAAEADGKQLKRDLAKELRGVMEPIKVQVVRRLLQVRSSGHNGPSMRQAIAKQTRAGVRFSGRNVGVNLVQRARGMPRGFRHAGRAFNRKEGWHPQSLGGVKMHQQVRPIEWFDQPSRGAERDARKAAMAAMERMAQRLAARARK